MKRVIVTVLLMSMIFVMGIPAQAAVRRDRIKSKGSVSFEEGKIFLTAEDFHYLAEQIDSLEGTYKVNTIDALNFIGTYFKKDGSIQHEKDKNEIATENDKLSLTLSQIIQGIRESQSISSLKGTQAVNKDGQPLFYQSEDANGAKNHLEAGTQDTGLPLNYKEAVSDNLSAGCAAWINGVLVKGNGADNDHFRELGYREGYTKGVAEALGKVNVVYQYHQHEGVDSQVGGCYGNVTGTRPVLCGCDNYAWADYDGNGTSSCANCWHNHGGDTCTATRTYESYTYIGLTCNKTTDTIESATIQY